MIAIHFFCFYHIRMVYVVVGPTCSGKTSLAISISEVKNNCPIINGDAFQIYKDMDIGTSKISKSDKAYDRHSLLDIVEPSQTFSVMEYQKIARECLDKLLQSNKDVVIVGGTGLYIKALLYDYQFKEEETNNDEELEALDNHELHLLLEKMDKAEAEKIHENNRKRMIRAISMMRKNDYVKSEFIASQEHKIIYPDVKIYFLNPNREVLYENINQRVIEMMDNGLVNEVKNLLKKYELSLTAKQGIGYKEVISYLNNEINMEECISLIQKRTRNYAKRQVTFFKHQFGDLKTYDNKDKVLEDL